MLARHRMLVALASPGLIDKAAAAPAMTTLVGLAAERLGTGSRKFPSGEKRDR